MTRSPLIPDTKLDPLSVDVGEEYLKDGKNLVIATVKCTRFSMFVFKKS